VRVEQELIGVPGVRAAVHPGDERERAVRAAAAGRQDEQAVEAEAIRCLVGEAFLGSPGDRWFAELTSRKLRRSAHRSVTELEADIRKWINEWNKDPKPFAWTESADEILETLATYCQRIIDSGH
jgi:hypothetical protein